MSNSGNHYGNLYESLSKKLGPQEAEKLKKMISENVNGQEVLSRLNKEQKTYLEYVLNNPKMLEKLLASKQADEIIKKFIGGGKNGK